MKESLKWFLGLGIVFLVVLFIVLSFTSNMADAMKRESYVVLKHNVEGDELVTFKSRPVMNANPDYFFMKEDNVLIHPKQKELEKTLEVMIHKDGKKETVRFKHLEIIPEDVEEMIVSFDPKDDSKSVDGTLYIPSSEAIYK
ncbi:hypothetical protein JMA_38350 (plasmid) [Jeotgalibacillus malaysiensis]|uniref:Uncharacterized protein n=1 Tax=Jeotgalibacillus malaysiensis TaxID=1508404 RepID=A0A0B5AX60_9BACL|nr:hypothetical protein [Jeotgalibacillus malaysiensis]AJD93153.1 hypothetical protein JMA_38350 [Jeotgalibacillus malaysiensis]